MYGQMRNNSANGDYVSRVTQASLKAVFLIKKGTRSGKEKVMAEEGRKGNAIGKMEQREFGKNEMSLGKGGRQTSLKEGADSRVTGDDVFITVRVGVGGIVDGEKCQSHVLQPLLGWMSREISNDQ